MIEVVKDDANRECQGENADGDEEPAVESGKSDSFRNTVELIPRQKHK